jgi:hypothetical protein
MLSSRCDTVFPKGKGNRKLTAIREDLKKEIEKIKIGSKEVFEVWINEATDPMGGKWDAWDVCVQAATDCDLFIALNNGEAGWAEDGSTNTIGVCHAELMAAYNATPAKVSVVELQPVAKSKRVDVEARNAAFKEYAQKVGLFRGGSMAMTESELKDLVHGALHSAVISLTQAGVVQASKGRNHSGAALDWSRLDFIDRQRAMIKVLREALRNQKDSGTPKENFLVQFGSVEVLLVPHAIPAAMSVGPARELVGQPFLKDHLLASAIPDKCGGPVHIIACHKSATENQAATLLGFHDAMIIPAPFGVFVADRINKVQFVFLTNCHDPSSTKHAAQRFLAWLKQNGEDERMATRALARARIVKAIADEI